MSQTISRELLEKERSDFKYRWEQAMQNRDTATLSQLVNTYIVDEQKHIRLFWIDTTISILFIGYQIIAEELQNGYSHFLPTYVDNNTWIRDYYHTKFMLRRMEYHSEPEIRKEVYQYLKAHDITLHAIKVLSEKSIVNRELLFCRLAYTAWELGDSEAILSYLVIALDWNEHNINTLYTLCYLLLQLGELQMAQDYFKELKNLHLPAIEELGSVLSTPSISPSQTKALSYQEILTFESKSIRYNEEQTAADYEDVLTDAITPTVFSFIVCVSNETYFEESKWYIQQLHLPEHCQLQIVPIRGAVSMTSGYNQGMKEANAKVHTKYQQHIKIYIHQDIMLTNRYLLYDLLKAPKAIPQQNQPLGLLGVIGTDQMPASGIWWESESYHGGCIEDRILLTKSIDGSMGYGEYSSCEGLDGIFLASYTDIPWREDLFPSWHFYDISQCQEFHQSGYQVVTINNGNAWCIHDCKVENIDDTAYEKNRQIYLKNYHHNM